MTSYRRRSHHYEDLKHNVSYRTVLARIDFFTFWQAQKQTSFYNFVNCSQMPARDEGMHRVLKKEDYCVKLEEAICFSISFLYYLRPTMQRI